MLQKKTIKLLKNEEKNFKNLFSVCIGNTYMIQKRFIEYVGNYSRWNTDVNKCILELDYRKFDVEYIGTTSKSDNYWYSSEIEKVIPHNGIKLMHKANKNLKKYDFIELTQPKIQINNELTAYNLSMIYITFTNEKTAYFCGSGNTSVYMFVKHLPDNIFKKINSVEFSNVVFEIVSTFNVNHKLMVKALLTENDIEFCEEGNDIFAKFNERSIIKVQFNDYGIVKKLSGNLSL